MKPRNVSWSSSGPLLMLVPMLCAISALPIAGCATNSQQVSLPPEQRLKLPELSDSAKPQPRPPQCADGCSKAVSEKLKALEQTHSQWLEMLTPSSQPSASAPQTGR